MKTSYFSIILLINLIIKYCNCNFLKRNKVTPTLQCELNKEFAYEFPLDLPKYNNAKLLNIEDQLKFNNFLDNTNVLFDSLHKDGIKFKIIDTCLENSTDRNDVNFLIFNSISVKDVYYKPVEFIVKSNYNKIENEGYDLELVILFEGRDIDNPNLNRLHSVLRLSQFFKLNESGAAYKLITNTFFENILTAISDNKPLDVFTQSPISFYINNKTNLLFAKIRMDKFVNQCSNNPNEFFSLVSYDILPISKSIMGRIVNILTRGPKPDGKLTSAHISSIEYYKNHKKYKENIPNVFARHRPNYLKDLNDVIPETQMFHINSLIDQIVSYREYYQKNVTQVQCPKIPIHSNKTNTTTISPKNKTLILNQTMNKSLLDGEGSLKYSMSNVTTVLNNSESIKLNEEKSKVNSNELKLNSSLNNSNITSKNQMKNISITNQQVDMLNQTNINNTYKDSITKKKFNITETNLTNYHSNKTDDASFNFINKTNGIEIMFNKTDGKSINSSLNETKNKSPQNKSKTENTTKNDSSEKANNYTSKYDNVNKTPTHTNVTKDENKQNIISNKHNKTILSSKSEIEKHSHPRPTKDNNNANKSKSPLLFNTSPKSSNNQSKSLKSSSTPSKDVPKVVKNQKVNYSQKEGLSIVETLIIGDQNDHSIDEYMYTR